MPRRLLVAADDSDEDDLCGLAHKAREEGDRHAGAVFTLPEAAAVTVQRGGEPVVSAGGRIHVHALVDREEALQFAAELEAIAANVRDFCASRQTCTLFTGRDRRLRADDLVAAPGPVETAPGPRLSLAQREAELLSEARLSEARLSEARLSATATSVREPSHAFDLGGPSGSVPHAFSGRPTADDMARATATTARHSFTPCSRPSSAASVASVEFADCLSVASRVSDVRPVGPVRAPLQPRADINVGARSKVQLQRRTDDDDDDLALLLE